MALMVGRRILKGKCIRRSCKIGKTFLHPRVTLLIVTGRLRIYTVKPTIPADSHLGRLSHSFIENPTGLPIPRTLVLFVFVIAVSHMVFAHIRSPKECSGINAPHTLFKIPRLNHSLYEIFIEIILTLL
jgi:hypothetical protein